jgi:hypothetical protein
MAVDTGGGGLTGRLVEVALENVLVEDHQCFEDLESVLVGSRFSDLVVQFLVGQRLFSLESLERQRRRQLRCLVGRRVLCKSACVAQAVQAKLTVNHGKIDVQHTDLGQAYQ